jgi:anti-sigma B factor antagonist
MAEGSVGSGDLLRVDRDAEGTWHLVGEVDLSNADALLARLEPSVQATDAVVLDLTGLTFMDSSGIRVIVLLMQRLSDGGRMVLRLREGPVARTVRLMDLGSLPNVDVEMMDG